MELAELGSQRSGRVFTILCGSAACTPMLISKNAVYDAMLVHEYPLVQNSQNLNGNKYSPLRAARKISQIREEFDVIASHYQITAGCDVLYFLAGSNLRAMDKAMKILKRPPDTRQIDLLFEIVKPPKLWDLRAMKTLEENKGIAKALNDALVQKNFYILQKAYSNPQSFMEIKWIDELKYLGFDEIRKAANKAGCKDYHLVINSLVDKGYYSADSDLQHLGPGRPLDLLYVFPLYANQSWVSLVQLKLMGVTVEAGKGARRQLLTNAIQYALEYIKVGSV